MFSTVRYAKLNPNAKPPFRKNPTDAGLDFYSSVEIKIPPHSMAIVSTGIAIEIPVGYALFLRPKSKNDHLVGAGVLDALYEPGEVLVKIVNISDYNLLILPGQAIAQGIFSAIETPEPKEVSVEQLENNSSRSGKGGIVSQNKVPNIPQELIRD